MTATPGSQGHISAAHSASMEQFFAQQFPQSESWQFYQVPQLLLSQQMQDQLQQQLFRSPGSKNQHLPVHGRQRSHSNSISTVDTQRSSRSSTRCSTPTTLNFPSAGSVLDASVCHPLLLGNVLRLSRSKEGCREVQDMLENAVTDEVRAAVAAELHGHVIETVKCVNANHVLQKLIMTTNQQCVQFIVDELCALGPDLGRIAKHKCGCRIFQRLLEICCPAQLQELVEIIMADALALSGHLYGNYVVQGILEHGTPDQRHRLLALLVDHANMLAADIHGAATLGAALRHASAAEGLQLARALLREPTLLSFMARYRRAYPTVILVLDALDGHQESEEAKRQLLADIDSLLACRYGKFVALHLMRLVDTEGQA